MEKKSSFPRAREQRTDGGGGQVEDAPPLPGGEELGVAISSPHIFFFPLEKERREKGAKIASEKRRDNE